ncbi:MAG: glycosyltransferase [Candidatus Heimdallarchaeaceae archaeon]
MNSFSNLTVIVPTLNEEKAIQILLEELEKYVPEAKAIVTDDGSFDNTKQNVISFEGNLNVKFLDRSKKPVHGLTASVLDAILQTETPYFLVMDADLQHPPKKLPEFYEELNKGFDLVVGKRRKVKEKWSFHRKLISYSATILGKIVLSLRNKNKCQDIMSGFFASKTEIWKDLIQKKEQKFTLEGYKVLFDFLKAFPKKIRIQEVEYDFGHRDYGSSKINKRIIWLYFKSLFK